MAEQSGETPGQTATAIDSELTEAETRSAPETQSGDALIARPSSRQVGRFAVLEQLGAGGMGVVVAAYDPTLDRRVAIKMLHGERWSGAVTRGRAQLVAEAQAMAKLAHPNVVALHEIGFDADGAFLVMEYVAGVTLRGWLDATERPWPQIVAMFVAAGEGLAAAHRAGLVHRDFKPDNVLIDRDGRARVGDFGLAAIVEGAGVTGSRSGTLPYMAPEQLRGEPCDARADQFAYCVALWEALHGTRPFAGATAAERLAEIEAGRLAEPKRRPPEWLRTALLRGLAADPAARWPSIAALLDAIRRDPRARRRRVLAGAAVTALAGGALWLAWPSAASLDPCSGARARLAGVWDLARQVEVHAAFAATGRRQAEDTWQRVRDRLDDYASSWVAMTTETCRATVVDHRQPDAMMDLRMSCLADRRGVLGALSSLWARGLDADALNHAVVATGDLPALAACADTRTLNERVPEPLDPIHRGRIAQARIRIDEVKAQMLAHRLAVAKRAAPEARAAAEATEWATIRAEAAVLEADLLAVLGDPDSEARLLAASKLADAARDDRLRAASLLRLASYLANQQQAAEAAQRMLALAEGPVDRVGDDALRGQLLRTRGKVLVTSGKYPQARDAFAAARPLLVRALGEGHASTVATVADLAQATSLTGDYGAARALLEHDLAIATRSLGPDHPNVAELMSSLATTMFDGGDRAAAIAMYRQALAIDELVFGDSAPTATTLANLARAELKVTHYAEARRLNERAVAIRERLNGRDHISVALPLQGLGIGLLHEHKIDDALATVRRVRDIMIRAYGPTHVRVCAARTIAAEVLGIKGDIPGAVNELREILKLRAAALGADHPQTLLSAVILAGWLARQHGCREARPLLEHAVAKLAERSSKANGLAEGLVFVARCDVDEHHPEHALTLLERANAAFDAIGAEPVDRGEATWERARALDALGRHGDAMEAARVAEQRLADNAERIAELAEVRAWLAARSAGR